MKKINTVHRRIYTMSHNLRCNMNISKHHTLFQNQPAAKALPDRTRSHKGSPPRCCPMSPTQHRATGVEYCELLPRFLAFDCKPLRATISLASCAARWAKAESGSSCHGCRVGAAHAGRREARPPPTMLQMRPNESAPVGKEPLRERLQSPTRSDPREKQQGRLSNARRCETALGICHREPPQQPRCARQNE